MIKLPLHKLIFYKNGLLSYFFRKQIHFVKNEAIATFSVLGKDLDSCLKTLIVHSTSSVLKEVVVRKPVKVMGLINNAALVSLLKILTGKKIEVFDGDELITGILLGLEENTEMITGEKVNKVKAILLSTEKGIKIIPLLRVHELFIPEEIRKEVLRGLTLSEDSFEINLVFIGEGEDNVAWNYTAEGYGWVPTYELIIRDESKLLAFTIIRNNTSYDWEDIDLEFSTAQPLFKSIIKRARPKAVKKTRNIVQEEFALAAIPEAEVEEYTGVGSELRVQDFIVRGVSLKRNEQKKLPLFSINVSTNVFSRWRTYENIAEKVIEITNNSERDIISGPMSIYLKELFIGLVQIDNLTSGGKTEITLGADNRLQVMKTQQLIKETTGILRQGVKRAYETTLRITNFSAEEVRMVIEDEPPEGVLKPEIINANIEPEGFERGSYIWRIVFKPKETLSIKFNYVYKE